LLLFSFSFPFLLLLLVLVLRRALLCNGNTLASTHARTHAGAPATQGLRESHPNQRLISPKNEIKNKIEKRNDFGAF
jgi:hypothetical protein